MRVVGGVDAGGRGISVGIEAGVQGGASPESPYIDASGLTVVPGFIDIQVNGAFGFDFTEDPESIWAVGERLPETGVTAFCPTIITSPPEQLMAAQQIMGHRPDGYGGAEPIGLHVEGPFLSEQKRGTHPSHLLESSVTPHIATEHVKIVTVAPELPGALELIATLVADDVVVSVGHSMATASETRAALDAGATLGTHLFNAMPPITAREPGIAGVLLTDQRAFFGVIADGFHLEPAALRLAWNAAPDRLVLTTDAIAAAGMPDGGYTIGSIEVTVSDGEVRNQAGDLAGSAITMDRELAVFAETTGSPFGTAVKAVTLNPSEAVGRWDLGRLRPGARGDLTLLDGTMVAATVVGGQVSFLHEPDRWMQRF